MLPEVRLRLRLRSEIRLSALLLSEIRLICWRVLLRESALLLRTHARLCGIGLRSFEIALPAIFLLPVPSARLSRKFVVLFPSAVGILPSARGSYFVFLFVRRFHVRYLVVVVGAQIC